MNYSIILLLSLSLCACQYLGNRNLEIHQGNDFTPQQATQLSLGLSKQEVARIMGTPVHDNLFSKNDWHYVYSERIGNHKAETRRLSLQFKNDKLIHITRAEKNGRD